MNDNTKGSSGGLAIVGVVLIAAAALYVGLAASGGPRWPHSPQLVVVPAFLANLLGVALLIMGLGYAVTGLPTGFFMSSYYKYSLSKLQVALWTVLVIGALATTAEVNILMHSAEYGDPDNPVRPFPKQDPAPDKNPPHLGPLDISIPEELLFAMGISLASLAGATAVLSMKGSQDPAPASVDAMKDRVALSTGLSQAQLGNAGNVATNLHRADARWLNVVSGDEVANAGMIDLSKVQQLLVTLLLVLGYAGVLAKLFSGGTVIAGLPPLGSYAVGLLAISHAGYLAYKAAPKAAPESASDARDAVVDGAGRRQAPAAALVRAPAE